MRRVILPGIQHEVWDHPLVHSPTLPMKRVESLRYNYILEGIEKGAE